MRQRYVNDLAGVAHSVYYDWQDDGSGGLKPGWGMLLCMTSMTPVRAGARYGTR